MAHNDKDIEIGVLEECDSFLLESRFFPSKLGGRPAWLDLKDLPSDLSCGHCKRPCIFLCQIYAPIDDNPNCHHRTIFIFICPNKTCCNSNDTKNFKVYRCQLPVINNFYPTSEPVENESWHPECKVENYSRVCALCGNPAPFNCGKCKNVAYCSKEHQISDWKLYGHKVNCGSDLKESRIEIPFLFPQLEIAIELPPEELNASKTDDDISPEHLKMLENLTTGTLDHLTDEDIEKYAFKEEDKYFRRYKKRINECPEQVLRYDLGGEPLFASKPTFTGEDIPPCDNCGGLRQYEFQILSTLLNEISGGACVNGYDWGTLLIYTCKANCNTGSAYKSEFMYKQEII